MKQWSYKVRIHSAHSSPFRPLCVVQTSKQGEEDPNDAANLFRNVRDTRRRRCMISSGRRSPSKKMRKWMLGWRSFVISDDLLLLRVSDIWLRPRSPRLEQLELSHWRIPCCAEQWSWFPFSKQVMISFSIKKGHDLDVIISRFLRQLWCRHILRG
jgi:hypothetical protein